MSCRSTACGSAVSSVTTAISGCSADQASQVFHALRAQYREEGLVAPADRVEVLSMLERYAWQVRNMPGLTASRKGRVLRALEDATVSVASGGEVPDEASFRAWQAMPAAAGVSSGRAVQPYHLRFRRFDRRTLAATDTLFSARPSRLEVAERGEVFERWVYEVSDIYSMERPDVVWDEEADYGGGGFYAPGNHTITLSPNRPSITTLIHETRHALQTKQKGAPMVSSDVEEDARAWSLSLYYKVRPRLFERLVREGRIFHINGSDLS